MALEGNLRDFGVQDILQLITLQRKTGVLTIRGINDTVYITFLDGKIINADSEKARVELKLGRVLLKRGSITEEQLNNALKIQKETLQRLGYVLVKNGFISNEELKAALTQQILEIVYKIFRWKEGEYHFSQENIVEYDRESINPIDGEAVLMEGAQRLDEWPIIERVIKSPDMVFERTPINQKIEISEKEEFDFESGSQEKGGEVIKLTQQVYDVYKLVDGTSSVSEIVERSRYNEFQVSKALYELVSRNLIQERKEAPPELPKVEVPLIVEEVKPLKFAVLPILILLILFVVGNLFRFKNPLNKFNSITTKNNIFEDVKYLKSFLNIYIIDNSLKNFFLNEAQYPTSLQELTKYNFTDLKDLSDPWKRGYLYIQKDKNYYLIGFKGDGTQSLELIYTYILSRGMEQEFKDTEKKKKRTITFTD